MKQLMAFGFSISAFPFEINTTVASFCHWQEYTGPGGAEIEVEKPSKDEISVAKWLKRNVPTKKTKFLNHNVEYFTGKTILLLLEYMIFYSEAFELLHG